MSNTARNLEEEFKKSIPPYEKISEVDLEKCMQFLPYALALAIECYSKYLPKDSINNSEVITNKEAIQISNSLLWEQNKFFSELEESLLPISCPGKWRSIIKDFIGKIIVEDLMNKSKEIEASIYFDN